MLGRRNEVNTNVYINQRPTSVFLGHHRVVTLASISPLPLLCDYRVKGNPIEPTQVVDWRDQFSSLFLSFPQLANTVTIFLKSVWHWGLPLCRRGKAGCKPSFHLATRYWTRVVIRSRQTNLRRFGGLKLGRRNDSASLFSETAGDLTIIPGYNQSIHFHCRSLSSVPHPL